MQLAHLAQVLAKAADALSAGDLVNRKVRQYGSWGLMPFAAAIGSVYPATYMRGNRETYHPMESNWPRSAGLPPAHKSNQDMPASMAALYSNESCILSIASTSSEGCTMGMHLSA